MYASSAPPYGKAILAAVGLLGAAACAALEPSPIESAVMRYYERHASEQHGRCLNPYMDALTKLEAVDDTEARLVVDARYFYRDRFMDGGDGMGVECAGFSERRFTLARDGGDLRVIEMSDTAPR